MQVTRVVCFDLGGVLVRICRTFIEACERAGLPVRDRTWLETDGSIGLRRRVMLDYQEGLLSTDEYFLQMSRALGHRYSGAEVALLHDAWLIDEYAGALELVTQLAAHETLTTACLSNTNERHWQALQANRGQASAYPAVMALERRFASHLLRANKPTPEIFLAFQQQMEVGAGEILFFDDSPDNVAAARSLGWRAQVIDPSGDTVADMRRHLVSEGVTLRES